MTATVRRQPARVKAAFAQRRSVLAPSHRGRIGSNIAIPAPKVGSNTPYIPRKSGCISPLIQSVVLDLHHLVLSLGQSTAGIPASSDPFVAQVQRRLAEGEGWEVDLGLARPAAVAPVLGLSRTCSRNNREGLEGGSGHATLMVMTPVPA